MYYNEERRLRLARHNTRWHIKRRRWQVEGHHFLEGDPQWVLPVLSSAVSQHLPVVVPVWGLCIQ
eukprot:8660140-Ditylum_brightwellii.AAC.1